MRVLQIPVITASGRKHLSISDIIILLCVRYGWNNCCFASPLVSLRKILPRMTTQKESRDEIRARIKPTLDKVAVKGLRAWLKAIGLSSAAYTRPTITNLVADEIAEGRLAEEALEKALIGFEEASDMRIYLYRLDELPKGETKKWLPTRLLNAGFAITSLAPLLVKRRNPCLLFTPNSKANCYV